MEKLTHLLRITSPLLLLIVMFLHTNRTSGAVLLNSDETDGRQATIVLSVFQYEWWLIQWSDNSPLCQVFTDHEGLPTGNDIYSTCGKEIYQMWASTPPCESLQLDGSNAQSCSGLYLHMISSEPADKKIKVDLPPAVVWVNLSGCTPKPPENFCEVIPSLQLTGEEPLPNEEIIGIHAVINGSTFSCEGSTCEVPLRPTLLTGTTVEFWADSSFGDSTEHFTAQVRVIDSGVSPTPYPGGWYVDVLSSQWLGTQIASCAQSWQAFPPVGVPPSWLSTPEDPALLATNEPYSYLAGRLISQGLVDASICPSDGLLANGYADTCGLEKAMPLVLEWQNIFDPQIFEVARQTGIPARLLKNVFAQESQFWPGAFKVPDEFGLGQLTDNGAETILLWNQDFYNQFCPLVFEKSTCGRGYIYLDEENQSILKGALAIQANADCPQCPSGVDLTHAGFSINLFAQILQANCDQVAQIFFNATGRTAGSVTDYEELWKYTVANYHVGPGCLSYAVYSAWSARSRMDWDHVSEFLTPTCETVIPYVEKISGFP
jgi:hypothetical protein